MDQWEADIAAGEAEEVPDTAADLLPARARPQEPADLERASKRASKAANRSPVTDAIRREIDPVLVAQAYREALSATRTIRFKGFEVEEPDHATRIRAADAIANRTDGMPVARTELTGADGGPVTLASLLASDARDTE